MVSCGEVWWVCGQGKGARAWRWWRDRLPLPRAVLVVVELEELRSPDKSSLVLLITNTRWLIDERLPCRPEP